MRIVLLLILLWPLAAFAQEDADLDAFLTAPPLPLDLAILGDDALAKEKVIGATGGTLSLANAAGDQFTLTFPEGAFLTSTAIRAIPISTSEGLPDGAGPITGLILEPDGLELARTATLEITPKTPIPPESRLHWGFYEDGKDAFLHIPLQDTDAIVIPIDHFSGAGIGFADRLNLQLDRWKQGLLEDRLRTQMAEMIRNIKASGVTETEIVTLALVEGKRRIVAGRRAIAGRSAATCDDIRQTAKAIMAIEKQAQLLGIPADEDVWALIGDLVERGFSVCLKDALDVCLATGDLSTLLVFAVEYERMRVMLAFTSDEAAFLGPEKVAAMKAAMERCGRYKLTVQARGHWEDGVGVYGDVDFKVEVPIRIKFSGDDMFYFDLVGEAPATDVNITFVDYACWVLDTYRQGAPMKAQLTDLVFDSAHGAKRVKLTMRGPQLFAVTSCTSKKRGKKTIESPVSESTWGIAHSGNRRGKVYVLETMKGGPHPRIFTYTWEGKGTAYNVTSNDTTSLTLEHVGG
jgi:hypothetical protein